MERGLGTIPGFNTFDAGSLGMCPRLFRPLPDPVRPSAHEPHPGRTFRRLAAASWSEDRRQSMKASAGIGSAITTDTNGHRLGVSGSSK